MTPKTIVEKWVYMSRRFFWSLGEKICGCEGRDIFETSSEGMLGMSFECLCPTFASHLLCGNNPNRGSFQELSMVNLGKSAIIYIIPIWSTNMGLEMHWT